MFRIKEKKVRKREIISLVGWLQGNTMRYIDHFLTECMPLLPTSGNWTIIHA